MWYDMMLLHMYVQIKVDECLIWSGMRWAFNLSRSWDTTDEQFKALVGMGMNPDCAVNLFVIIIKTANLTSELPNTVLTLLDSCKWLLDNGYQSNQCVIKHQCFIMQSNTVKLLCIYDIMALYMGPQLPSMMPCYLIHVYLWCNCAVCIYSACIDTINSAYLLIPVRQHKAPARICTGGLVVDVIHVHHLCTMGEACPTSNPNNTYILKI